MTQHIATASVVKVSIGSADGNSVARLVRRGDFLPEGVDEKDIERLVDRGLIAEVVEPVEIEAPDESWTVERIDEFAAKWEIEIPSGGKKDELAAIAAAIETRTAEFNASAQS